MSEYKYKIRIAGEDIKKDKDSREIPFEKKHGPEIEKRDRYADLVIDRRVPPNDIIDDILNEDNE